jgi:hypothetical protein
MVVRINDSLLSGVKIVQSLLYASFFLAKICGGNIF